MVSNGHIPILCYFVESILSLDIAYAGISGLSSSQFVNYKTGWQDHWDAKIPVPRHAD
jgi:hypothetical protein